MFKKCCISFAFFLLAIPLLAHEFWLQPERFIYQPGEEINLRFYVGENFEGENWNGNRGRVNYLQLYLDDASDDLSELVSEEKGDSLQLGLYDEGTAMITFNSNNASIQLDATKFNSYLQEDGLQEAIEYRTAHHQTDSTGKEHYQRSVKTLIQVGAVKNNISYATRLPLDIVPLTNPYNITGSDSLTARVFLNKTPLTNQLVKVWQRVGSVTTMLEYRTNGKGECTMAVRPAGKWMISTVKMVHLENNEEAAWQSYWGSCTWGYE
jgi:uncharacterized GH25 family protein